MSHQLLEHTIAIVQKQPNRSQQKFSWGALYYSRVQRQSLIKNPPVFTPLLHIFRSIFINSFWNIAKIDIINVELTLGGGGGVTLEHKISLPRGGSYPV